MKANKSLPPEVQALGRRFDWPVLLAAAAVLPIFLFESAPAGSAWAWVGLILNWASWSVFLIESLVMIRAGGWAWVRANPLSVIVTVLTPPFAPAGLAALRLLRFLRLLRLLPGLQAARRIFTLEGVKFAGLVAVVTIIGGGIAFSKVERSSDLDAVDGIWWAVTTVTTVGYGDLSPTTDGGRALAVLVMFVGIGFVALVTAFIAERFIVEKEEAEGATPADVIDEVQRLHERLNRIENLLLHEERRDQES